jgi:hypothetical protein
VAAKYAVHPTTIYQWKQAPLTGAAGIFEWGAN